MVDGPVYRKDLPDGRVIMVVAQIYNTMVTLGRGEQTWDKGY